MEQEKIRARFEETGALLTGHFLLSSGLHSEQYFQCAKVLQYPEHASKLGAEIAQRYYDQHITVVVGPAMGGIIIAHEVARALGVKCLFTEKTESGMQLRRGFKVSPDDRCIVVEDVITTGGSALKVVQLLKAITNVIGVASIVDRSNTPPDFDGVPYGGLLNMPAKTYEADNCPLCAEGLPITKPGSPTSLAK